MRVGMIILAAVAVCAAAAPTVAHAESFLTLYQAQSDARDDAAKRYGRVTNDGVRVRYVAFCWPQYHRRERLSEYAWQKWVCNWGDSTGCDGQVRIRGRFGSGNYASLVLRGQRCPSS